MSQFLAELCALLIEDTYGAFYSHIFTTLTLHGRLFAPQIAQKCHLPIRQIRCGLSVLIQAHLVYHHSTTDGRTSYQANVKAAYNLARSGRVIELVQRRLGEDAAVVVSQLMLLGHSRVGHLRQQVSSSIRERPGRKQQEKEKLADGVRPAVNDDSDDIPDGWIDFDDVLITLVDHGLILQVREAHFQTFADNIQDAEQHVNGLESLSTSKGKKAQEEFDNRVQIEVRLRNEASIKIGDWTCGSNRHTLKRPAEGYENGSRSKKAKLMNGIGSDSSNGTGRQGRTMGSHNEDVVIQVNYDKIIVLLRNQNLINLAGRRIGKSAAGIYASLLKQLEDSPFQWKDNFEPPPEAEHVDSDVTEVNFNKLLHAANAADEPTNGHESTMRNGHHPPPYINGHANGDSRSGEPITGAAIEETLHILAEKPYTFVSQDPDSRKWTVDYHQLAINLRNQEVLRVIQVRFGSIALRIIRILLDKGKLDEKCLQEIGLLSAKDLRQSLARLKSAGFIELQEVPREPQRQPSRTMYLWFYDTDRVRRMFLEDVYKTMARCLQRLKVERRKVIATVEKAERSDVKGREEEFLGKAELEVLAKWKRKEEWLLGEVGRLDDLVAIFRDF